MKNLHRLSSVIVFVFICLHLITHLIGLKGVAYHDVALQASRLILRDPILELSLLLVFLLQIITGYALSLKIWREGKDLAHQVQAASGTALSLFFFAHMAHLGYGRFIANIDPNFYYIHAAFTAPIWSWVFKAIYVIGIMAFFVHMAVVALEIVGESNRLLGVFLILLVSGLGAYIAYLLVSLFSGLSFPVEVPEAYSYLFRS